MQTLPIYAGDANLPDRLGRYRVVDAVGRGGSSVVYRALGPEGESVAVKTIARASEWGFASLRSEIQALCRVQHEGVVRFLDEGVDDGRPWFAMEWIEGETLTAHARRFHPVRTASTRIAWTSGTLEPVLRFVVRLCEALAVVHASGTVHRDLKPENVLVREGRPILIDFGIAVENAPQKTRAIAVVSPFAGTPGYMAPEQLTGEIVDARTDLYALGCILFELLVGAPPAGPDALPSHFANGIDDRVDTLVASLLDARPRHRVGHADDVITVIEHILQGRAKPAVRGLHQWLYRPILTGRATTLAQLSTRVDRFRAGRGSFVVLTGESGIGKTHIASEIARGLAGEATIVTVSSAPPAAARPPLSCWDPVLDLVVDRMVADPTSQLATVVAKHASVLASVSTRIATLAGSPLAAARPTPDEIIAALRDIIAALAAERPLVVLLDDLQWVDEVTLAALNVMVTGALLETPILFLATCRDDEQAPGVARLLESSRAERVTVGPLPDAALRELVADMLGVPRPPDNVVEWIAKCAEGNPFLAAEYLRFVVAEVPMEREIDLPEVRILPPERSRLDALPMPRSAHELAGRRLALLDEGALRLAELIAVIGGSMDAPVLAALGTDAEARNALANLQRHQLLEYADGRARLIHDRVRVAAVRRLSADRKQSYHRTAAELLRSVPQPEHAAIAHHFAEAGLPADALPHMEAAGEAALSRAAYDAAARHFEDARSVADALTRTGATFTPLRRVKREHGAARAQFGRGQLLASEQRVRDALAVTGATLPTNRSGWVAMAAFEAMKLSIFPAPSGASLEPALLAELASAVSLLPERYFYEEDMMPVLGTSLLASNLARRAGVAAAPGPSSTLAAMAGLFRMTETARRFFDDAYRSAAAKSDWRSAAQVLALESFHHGGAGRFRDAEQAALRAVQAGHKTTDPWTRENAETTLAHVEFFTGRFEAARERAKRVAELAAERRNEQHELWGLYLEARSDIVLGRFDSARPLLERAIVGLHGRDEIISEIACKGMLADVCSAVGDMARAETLAMDVVERVGKRLPTAYPSLVGYTGAAVALRRLIARASSSRNVRAAVSLTVALWRFASLFPMASPSAHLHTAHLLKWGGLRRSAEFFFLRGAAQAQACSMPYDRGLLLLGAASVATSEERRETFDTAASAILRQLGAHAGI